MKDIQDGIKISVQNGVEEDPTVEEKFVVKSYSFAGLIYKVKSITNPTILSSVHTSTDAKALVGTIGTIIGTVVA